MSRRLQVLVPDGLDARIRKAAQRSWLSKGAWVRRALDPALGEGSTSPDAPDRQASLGASTAGIDQMFAEIEAGRL